MIDILAIGELLIDFTPVKTKDGMCFKPNPGGAPCNMLAMAQSMGAQTAFIGKVGHDQFGKTLKETLIKSKINVEGLILSDVVPTTLAFVHLTDEGDRSFSFYRKGCADVMLEDIDINYKLIDEAQLIHFGSLSFTDEPSKSSVEKAIAYAKEKGKLISYDPNYRSALWNSEAEALAGMRIGLKYADMIKVSDEEAELLTGEKDPEKAAKVLFDMGISLITITLGEAGVYYLHKTGSGIIKGFKSQVIDTTGAGDSFFGAVIAQIMLSGYDTLTHDKLQEILTVGNAAASIVIEGLGGIPSIPSKEKVLERTI